MDAVFGASKFGSLASLFLGFSFGWESPHILDSMDSGHGRPEHVGPSTSWTAVAGTGPMRLFSVTGRRAAFCRMDARRWH